MQKNAIILIKILILVKYTFKLLHFNSYFHHDLLLGGVKYKIKNELCVGWGYIVNIHYNYP